jgi:hypothetical protein
MKGVWSLASGARGPGLVCAVATSVALCVVFASCSVGEGSGHVTGTLNVMGCSTKGIFPSPSYNLQPDFFVGQPIDADPISAPTFPANQMIVRVQHSGARLEFADALLFWFLDSAQVARCLRGRGPPMGAQEWDSTLCDRSAPGPSVEGRILIGMTYEIAFSSFALSASCPKSLIFADALGACTDNSCPDLSLCPGRGSWISFSRYGSLPADPAQDIPDGFKVNDGERITATAFHVELCDTATVEGKLANDFTPIPKPKIVGTLQGDFDFTLERGQAGQPFP